MGYPRAGGHGAARRSSWREVVRRDRQVVARSREDRGPAGSRKEWYSP